MSVQIAIYKRSNPASIIPVIEMTIPCSENDVINAVRNFAVETIKNKR